MKLMHQIDFNILGEFPQMIEIELPPGNAAIGNKDLMVGIDPGIEALTVYGDGSRPVTSFFNHLVLLGTILDGSGDRKITTVFRNQTNRRRNIYFRGQQPGAILPIDLSEMGGRMVINMDAFLCGAKGAEIENPEIESSKAKLEEHDLALRIIRGDGWVFLASAGMLSDVYLKKTQKMLFTLRSFVAMETSVSFKFAKFENTIPELDVIELKGPGSVWFQSHPPKQKPKTELESNFQEEEKEPYYSNFGEKLDS